MATGQTLWSMSREEYDRLAEAGRKADEDFGEDLSHLTPEQMVKRLIEDDCDYCKAAGDIAPRFPPRVPDDVIEQALKDLDEGKVAEEDIDWFAIIRAFG